MSDEQLLLGALDRLFAAGIDRVSPGALGMNAYTPGRVFDRSELEWFVGRSPHLRWVSMTPHPRVQWIERVSP